MLPAPIWPLARHVSLGQNWFDSSPLEQQGPLVAPDIAVIKGVALDPELTSWRVQTTGPAPHVVVEILSNETWKKDLEEKPDLYARLGIHEVLVTRLLLSGRTRAKQVKAEVVEAPDDLHIFACPIFTFVLNGPGQFWHTPLLEVVCILLVAVKVLVGVRPPGSYLVNGDRSEHCCRAVAAKVADHETGDALPLSLLLPGHSLTIPCVGERLPQGQPMFPAIGTQQVLALAVSLPGIPPVGEFFATRY
ncbi:MAG TPA: Uma2 family endonuclease [Ktedonobacteraceae bacterium]|nr:Uma2 family endonuclease [Ktedonobacteraceae bacterium]